MAVDHDLIARIKSINKVSKVTEFELFDRNGRFAKSRDQVVTVTIQFDNGQKYKVSWETFLAFGNYKFDIGFVEQ